LTLKEIHSAGTKRSLDGIGGTHDDQSQAEFIGEYRKEEKTGEIRREA
jgi:hypothetical protein